MAGHDSNSQSVADHDHRHFIHSEFILKILGVTSVAETFRNHCPLVDRGCHEHVDIPCLDILYSSFKRSHCRFCRFRCRLTRLDKHVLRQAVDDIHSFLVNILRRADYVCVDLIDIVNLLLVEAKDF